MFSLFLVYWLTTFLHMQHALHRSIIKDLNPNSRIENITTKVERFPFPPYTTDEFIYLLWFYFPYYLALCFLVVSISIPREITVEKQATLKVCRIFLLIWLVRTFNPTRLCIVLFALYPCDMV